MKQSLWLASGILLLQSCASAPDRAPAATTPGIPWSPGIANNGYFQQLQQRQQPVAQTQQQQQHGAAPLQSWSGYQGGCSLHLDQIPIGGGYSVAGLLYTEGVYGTFTKNYGQDQKILAQWFPDSAPGSVAYDLAKNSHPFFRAIQYVNGNNSDLWGRMTAEDYQLGARMAAVLVAMMATSSDPECQKYIRTNYADKMLGTYAKELDEIPTQKVSELVKAKTIGPGFHDIEMTRESYVKQLADQESAIKLAEKDNAYQLKKLKLDLNTRLDDLRSQLAIIAPPCKTTVKFLYLTDDSGTTSTATKDQVDDLVQKCTDTIHDKLLSYQSDEIDLQEKYREMKQRQGNQNFPGSEESRLSDRIDQLAKTTRELQGYQEQLAGAAKNKSLSTTIDQIDVLLKNRDDLLNKDFIKDDTQKKNAINEQMKQISSRWLAYGYFGGLSANPDLTLKTGE